MKIVTFFAVCCVPPAASAALKIFCGCLLFDGMSILHPFHSTYRALNHNNDSNVFGCVYSVHVYTLHVQYDNVRWIITSNKIPFKIWREKNGKGREGNDISIMAVGIKINTEAKTGEIAHSRHISDADAVAAAAAAMCFQFIFFCCSLHSLQSNALNIHFFLPWINSFFTKPLNSR